MSVFDRLFPKRENIKPGMYHYQAPPDDPRNYRLHLRIEPDGRGMLVVNAATVLHLNETAAEYAYYFIHNIPADKVAKNVSARYNVDPERARQDYLDIADRVLSVVEIPDLDPVTYLDFDRKTPYSTHLSAPLRLDCAITYQLPPGADAEAAPTKRVERELTTEEWKTILTKAWDAGIPHVVFTGGEPTLRQDLPELIKHAEANGQVSGLLTDGVRLADASYLDTLLQTGLDHLLLVLQPENQAAWQALKQALAADIYVVVHLTVNAQNSSGMPDLLRRLASTGVTTVSLSAQTADQQEALQNLRNLADDLHLSLVWDLPVPYSALNPVALELAGDPAPSGAGHAWLYLEPDGDVLPAQGETQVLGNLLRDPWEKIWHV